MSLWHVFKTILLSLLTLSFLLGSTIGLGFAACAVFSVDSNTCLGVILFFAAVCVWLALVGTTFYRILNNN